MKTVLMSVYSLCQKLKHKLEQTTEQKMRKGLKCSDSVFICKVLQNHSISNVNGNYNFTKRSFDLNFPFASFI